MIKNILILLLLLIFTACQEKSIDENFDGKKLLETKCASCHDLNMPPVVSDKELAPPIMAVSFHVHSLVEPTDESQRTSKAIEFVSDYIFNPSVEKSFCDEYSLKKYGLMPSQKEKLSSNEAKAIASYMFNHYNQENLSKIQKSQAAYDALAPGEKIAKKNRCMGCHGIEKKKVGPSFVDIAKKYKDNKEAMIKSIRSGSRGIWSEGAVMPSFEQIQDKDLEILSEWILEA